MNFRFEELLSVEFHHGYFDHNKLYVGIKAIPAAKTQHFMQDNGLLFKTENAGFRVFYQTDAAKQEQGIAAILNTGTELTFRLDLADPNFYNYTGNLPDNAHNLIFDFRNYNPQNSYRKKGMLQNDEFISEADMIDTPLEDFSVKPFGQISIKLNPGSGFDFPQKFILHFDTLCTYRQYILRSDHFRSIENPAILDKSNQTVFEAPTEITLPDGSKAVSIVSKNPIPLTNTPQVNYRLVCNFNTKNNSFKELKTLLILPNPGINAITNITEDKNEVTTKKYSVTIL